MCGSMVDIQSPTAEIRQGKKKEEETGRKYICPHPRYQSGGYRPTKKASIYKKGNCVSTIQRGSYVSQRLAIQS